MSESRDTSKTIKKLVKEVKSRPLPRGKRVGEVLPPVGPTAAALGNPPVNAIPIPTSPGRTRTEIRRSCAATVDGPIREFLDLVVDRNLQWAKNNPAAVPDKDMVSSVQGVAQLYTQIGIGFIGVNTVDPAEVPNLPPPVFVTRNADEPLPDGASG